MCSLCSFINEKNVVRNVFCCGLLLCLIRWWNLYIFILIKYVFSVYVIVS